MHRVFAKINWWAIAIIAMQILIIWRVEVVRDQAEDASAQAYESLMQAQIAAEASEAVKDKLRAY
jgi:hypothetical protein